MRPPSSQVAWHAQVSLVRLLSRRVKQHAKMGLGLIISRLSSSCLSSIHRKDLPSLDYSGETPLSFPKSLGQAHVDRCLVSRWFCRLADVLSNVLRGVMSTLFSIDFPSTRHMVASTSGCSRESLPLSRLVKRVCRLWMSHVSLVLLRCNELRGV